MLHWIHFVDGTYTQLVAERASRTGSCCSPSVRHNNALSFVGCLLSVWWKSRFCVLLFSLVLDIIPSTLSWFHATEHNVRCCVQWSGCTCFHEFINLSNDLLYTLLNALPIISIYITTIKGGALLKLMICVSADSPLLWLPHFTKIEGYLPL